MKILNIKRILAVTFTLTITAAMLKIVSLALSYKDSDMTPYHFYKQKGDYDVLFLGTSHVGCGIYPMQLWNDRGITSYNLATSAADIATSYHILRNAIHFHRPKVAILDTLNMDSQTKVSGEPDFVHCAFDIIPLSWEKYKSLKDLFPEFNSRMAYILPFSIFHNRWRESTPEKAWDAIFHPSVPVWNGGWLEYSKKVASPAIYPKTEAIIPGNTVGMDYTRAFVSLCRENDILPILITIPFPASESAQMVENTAAILSQELGTDYYNLNQMEIIDWDTDLLDPDSHLNLSGARKVTDWLGKLLAEEYHLEDHRTDPSYDYWQQEYEAYRRRLFELLMRGLWDKKAYLMFCNNSAFTARLFIKDGVKLDSVEQKLVTQLGNAITVEHVGVPDDTTSDEESTAPKDSIPDLRLEVYDSETGSLICEKQW